MLNVPEAVGVPVMEPSAFSVKPAGSVPTTVKVYGATPPVTTMAGLLKATPTSPLLTTEQVTTGAATIVKGQLLPVATTPLASVTLMLKVPEAVGVPVMAPVEALSERPAGRVPTTVKA